MTRLLRAAQDDTPLLTTPERKRALELGRWTGDEHAAKLAFGLYPPSSDDAPTLEQLWSVQDSTVEMDLGRYPEVFRNLDSQLRMIEQLADTLSRSSDERRAVGLEAIPDGPSNPDALDASQLANIGELARALQSTSGLGSLGPTINALEDLAGALVDRQEAIEDFAEQVQAAAVEQLQVDGTTTADWATRAQSYVSVDVGTAVAPKNRLSLLLSWRQFLSRAGKQEGSFEPGTCLPGAADWRSCWVCRSIHSTRTPIR